MNIEKIEWIKHQLFDLANMDRNDIDSSEIEITGEDSLGGDAYCTADITDIAQDALDLITFYSNPAVQKFNAVQIAGRQAKEESGSRGDDD